MAKKNNKVSKIKSTKINKEELISNTNNRNTDFIKNEDFINSNIQDQEQESNNNNNEDNETIDHVQKQENLDADNLDNIDNKEQKVQENKNTMNAEIKAVDDKKQEELEKLKFDNIKLQMLVKNLQEENYKLKNNMEANQQQLIEKLKEKEILAQQQLEEKKIKLEQEKQEEINNKKDSIYIDVVMNFLEPFLLFEKTVSQPVDNEIIKSYLQGYIMIVSMFKDAFNNLGIEQIDVNVGDEFNANFMEAFDVEEDPNFPPNKVTKIVSKGFAYKNKVIKFTSVIVSK